MQQQVNDSWKTQLTGNQTVNLVHIRLIAAAQATELERHTVATHLRGEDESSAVLRQPSQIQSVIQVQDLTVSRSRVRCSHAVHRDGSWIHHQTSKQLQ